MGDLEEVIRVAWETVDATPKDHPDRATALNNLGLTLGDRYSRTGAMGDLEESIRVIQESVNSIPKDHPDRVFRLIYLRVQVSDRYIRTRTMSDLEEAIRIAQEAMDATPNDHPGRTPALSILGITLRDRYSRTGVIGDLEEAIRIAQEVVDVTPKDHPDRATALNNLGIGLGNRYSRTGVIGDLEEAIRIAQESVDVTPKDHPDRATRLNILGIRLGDRYSSTGATGDLEESIRVIQEAVNATPKDHPQRALYLNNLGNRLGDRYSRTGAMGDLEKAIRLAKEVVDTTPKDHPLRALWASNLAARLGDRYSKTGAIFDLEEAISCHQIALRQSNSLALTRIGAGQRILNHCAVIQDWQQAYDASSMAVYLASKLTARSLETSDKQHMLGQVVGLASNAAAAALNAAKSPVDALGLLEEGRGILATSLEDMRIDVSDLRDKHPGIAENFVRLRDELDQPVGVNISMGEETSQPFWQARANRRYEAGRELDALILDIRKQSGFEDFLTAPREGDMIAAARLWLSMSASIAAMRFLLKRVKYGSCRCLALIEEILWKKRSTVI